MGLRDRRAKRREEQETFGRGGSARRYRLRQKMLSIGDDFWIEDEDGEQAFEWTGRRFGSARRSTSRTCRGGGSARSRSG